MKRQRKRFFFCLKMFDRIILKFFCASMIILKVSQSADSIAEIQREVGDRNETTGEEINFVQSTSTEGTLFWSVPETIGSTEGIEGMPVTDGIGGLENEDEEIAATDKISSQTNVEETTDAIGSQTNVEEVQNSQTVEATIDDSGTDIQNNTETNKEETEKETSSDEPEEVKESGFGPSNPPNFHSKMDEKILLSRSNCNLEIPIEDGISIGIQIEFGPLKNDSHGKCNIVLMGKNSLLAIHISDVHLHEENGKEMGETLKVILTNHGIHFVLKEYDEREENNPLLLTQTNQAFIVLQYNVTTVGPSLDSSRFNLEVFGYGKSENNIVQNVYGKHDMYNSYYNPDMYNSYYKQDTYNKYYNRDRHNSYYKQDVNNNYDTHDKISSFWRPTIRIGADVEKIFITEEPEFLNRNLFNN